ncbi:hypothetical protein FSP39_009416 [Pinctada imbricata]|uniref:Transmembrane protein 59 n=1 Tax=Pinctada imbricata TaxID=66713 RepID=A0AA89BWN0_PINIB|nr:hypothetical protein FSP39_009416 [Pinctada imbricata]
MAKILQLLTVTSILFVVRGIGVFDRVLDDISSCVEACSNTYSPHTYEKGYLLDACKRGCRFFSIMEFVYCNHNSLNLTQQGCKASCEEAYSNKTDELDSCKFGCNSQIPHVIQQQKEDEQYEQNIHMLYPLMYIHNVYSNMIDKMYQGMSVRWSFYMQADNGKVVVMKTQPQLYAEIDNMEFEDDLNTANYLETNLEPFDRSATPDVQNSQLSGFHDDSEELSLDATDRRTSSDWLSCVSRKTGIPRELLSLLLLASAVMMIWLCLSALATSPDHWVKAEPQKLSINGDLEYLRELETKGLKLSFPQESEEAGPLPIKINVHRI